MPDTRTMLRNLKDARAVSAGGSDWLDLISADGSVVSVFMPKWIAEQTANHLNRCLMAQEDADAQARGLAAENAKYCSDNGMWRSRYPSLRDETYDS